MNSTLVIVLLTAGLIIVSCICLHLYLIRKTNKRLLDHLYKLGIFHSKEEIQSGVLNEKNVAQLQLWAWFTHRESFHSDRDGEKLMSYIKEHLSDNSYINRINPRHEAHLLTNILYVFMRYEAFLYDTHTKVLKSLFSTKTFSDTLLKFSSDNLAGALKLTNKNSRHFALQSLCNLMKHLENYFTSEVRTVYDNALSELHNAYSTSA